MSVTFQKLSQRVHEKLDANPDYPKLSQNQMLAMVTLIFDQIGDALSHGEDVYLEGFGRFYPDCKAPRKVKSGLTSETHITRYKVFVRFNPFKVLNKRVQRFLGIIGIHNNEEDTNAD